MISFVELQLNNDEEDIPDDLIMLVSGVKVEYILKSQESRLKTLIEDVDKHNDDRAVTQSRTFNNEISNLRDVSQECHERFEKQFVETKVFLKNQLKEIRILMATEVQKFDDNDPLLHKKVDVVANATTRLIKNITTFNIDY
ncbi:unnamed protein product [Lactuca saligna]|uniref:Uncharacterized protein n=1 Tax=Lactuca saligna TaxID=75948 RepID=A0AA35VUV6_LACSI|nr:unnamed protein product [Lactuca saligna]